MRIHEDKGTWRRFICAWWGHKNIRTLDIVHEGRFEFVCLRCWGRAFWIGDSPETSNPLEQ